MIKWIENGFIQSNDDSTIPLNPNQNNLDFSLSERDHRGYLHPITEESFWDGENDTISFENTQNYNNKFKIYKLKRVLDIWSNSNKIKLAQWFKKWSHFSVKISLQKLFNYKENVGNSQLTPTSGDEFSYDDSDSSDPSSL